MFLAILALPSLARGRPTVRRQSLYERKSAKVVQVELDNAGELQLDAGSAATSGSSSLAEISSSAAKIKIKLQGHAVPSCMSLIGGGSECMWTTDACPSITGAYCAPMATEGQAQDVRAAATICCNATGWVVPLNQSTDCYGADNQPGYETQGRSLPTDNPHIYSEAVAWCADRGHRLCTFSEVYSGQTCGAGCNMDCNRVWTSTPAACEQTDLSYQLGGRCHVGSNNISTSLLTAAACCSDDGIANDYKWLKWAG